MSETWELSTESRRILEERKRFLNGRIADCYDRANHFRSQLEEICNERDVYLAELDAIENDLTVPTVGMGVLDGNT